MSEGYCDKLLRADREKFGIIPNVTDKDWYHNSFAIEVLDYLNNKIEKAKKETGKLIALYGTPKMLGL